MASLTPPSAEASAPEIPLSWGEEPGVRVPAGLLSVVLHATLVVGLGLLAPPIHRPPPGEPTQAVGIALVERDGTNQPEYWSAGDSPLASSQSPAATGDPTTVSVAPSLNQLPIASELRLPATNEGAGAATGVALPSAAGLAGTRPGQGQGVTGGQTRTQVFGAQGEGSRFLYVFDRSSSMAGFSGRPIAAARNQLIRSLGDLTSTNQFQIIFYNEQPLVFNPFPPNPPKLFLATEDLKQLAVNHVGTVRPFGGTNHLDALRLALRMGADVMFFLTDATDPQLTPGELAEIRRRNTAATVIHAIEFGVGPFPGGENFMTRLARQNGGQHVYVDVTQLP